MKRMLEHFFQSDNCFVIVYSFRIRQPSQRAYKMYIYFMLNALLEYIVDANHFLFEFKILYENAINNRINYELEWKVTIKYYLDEVRVKVFNTNV